ncbi:MAG: YicC family protein, partial [Lachnospiraceae bacterium]|nr:YicC family protein [Lachnospiraceae bacterium]
VKYNEELAAEYYELLGAMSKRFGLENDIRTSTLARFPDIFTIEDESGDEEELKRDLFDAVEQAAKKFVETRIEEGAHLGADITEKLDDILKMVDHIEARSPEVVAEYRKKLTDKVAELLGDTKIDESILATEITIFADKICVDEETVRLRAHVNNMKKTLQEAVNVGRKLDFIAQEMNREANTILSKSSDLSISDTAIDLKTEIEKVREQIQNIE